ncbi:MAG: UTP--glucose-1-phosphate uridylyltransferase GalU [Alphaproteobacteria bacterium]
MQPIKKAVFPVGGLGTRFLPATKSQPKEMLTIVDKPLIQYAVEEAIDAGVEQFIFVTGKGKTSIEDHFDHSSDLEYLMKELGKLEAAEAYMPFVEEAGNFMYIRQNQPKGLGHAVWCARHAVGNEPFAVLLADDFIYGTPTCMREMVACYNQHQGNVVAVQQVPKQDTDKYGIVETSGANGHTHHIASLVEKPAVGTVDSNLAIVGRYILQPDIFTHIDTQHKGAGGEIQLTDAMQALLAKQEFRGVEFSGLRFDCGNKGGMMAANVHVAYHRDDIRDEFLSSLSPEMTITKEVKKCA